MGGSPGIGRPPFLLELNCSKQEKQVKLVRLITPQFIHNLQSLLSMGLKPDSFNAEIALARSLPNAERGGGKDTLVDVFVEDKFRVGIDMKATKSVKLYKRPKKDCFEYGGFWVSIPQSTMAITRRPDIDCFSDISAEEGLAHSVERLRNFYNSSKEKGKCKEIYSLLMQHSWDEANDFTVFNFSLSKFSIPEIEYAERHGKGFKGFDSKGELCLHHNAFTKGSQNFSKRYYIYDDHMTVIIKHPITQPEILSWDSLNDVTVLP